MPIPIPPKPTQPIAIRLLGAFEPNTEDGTTDGTANAAIPNTPLRKKLLRVILVFVVAITSSFFHFTRDVAFVYPDAFDVLSALRL